jgi:superfamily I DNA/RNA helicase
MPVGLGAVREFVSFVSLVSDEEDEGRQEVQLMSLHGAKGKEFPVSAVQV